MLVTNYFGASQPLQLDLKFGREIDLAEEVVRKREHSIGHTAKMTRIPDNLPVKGPFVR